MELYLWYAIKSDIQTAVTKFLIDLWGLWTHMSITQDLLQISSNHSYVPEDVTLLQFHFLLFSVQFRDKSNLM